jgi:hypothetical protein
MSGFTRSALGDEAEGPVENSFSALPEVVRCRSFSEGISAILGVQCEKEVSATDEKEVVEEFAYGLPFVRGEANHSTQHATSESNMHEITSTRKFGQGWQFWGVILAIALALAVGLGVGLGLGLPDQTWVNYMSTRRLNG